MRYVVYYVQEIHSRHRMASLSTLEDAQDECLRVNRELNKLDSTERYEPIKETLWALAFTEIGTVLLLLLFLAACSTHNLRFAVFVMLARCMFFGLPIVAIPHVSR